ncbi:tumor necrosis factor receptor superfamily member 11B-like isoform X2 [Ctenopharyngodon idella]|uniref:tumor necrosis factor receptor superfamily member 11B-like isoform X2 n=1 Tax=Ctenopharyngodon idella TaxID=7959 RepID=UPI00222FF74E|nr:tumor necrosis factor receptor superfamily member 11B-like isoform X2 [Ctenopharyngodon idella]
MNSAGSARGMLFFTVLVLPALSAVAAGGVPTYRRIDPVTGEALQCDRCAPGSRLRAHCTSSRGTECVLCGEGLFTEFWNYIPHCLLCDSCSDHQRVVRPCNGIVNTVCECEPGFYWDQHFCKRHTVCKPGHGVKAAGTPHKDTVCELCADGWFANITEKHAACVPHSACAADQLLLQGSRWHDNVCATCEELAEKGWSDLLKPVLSGLDIQYKTPILRLEHLVNRRLQKKLRKRDVQRMANGSTELLNLHMVIEDSHLGRLAGRISQIIQKFQQRCHNMTAMTV